MRALAPMTLPAVALTALLCALTPIEAFAATTVTDDITSDTTWTLAGSPYVINAEADSFSPHSLLVAAGVTLTIDPGVVVKFGSYNGLKIEGTLIAQGTTEQSIIYTALTDDAAGDTNADSDATTPTDREWMHIDFSPGSHGTLAYTTVRYGGQNFTPVPTTGIANYGGTLTLDHVTLTHNGYDGLGQYAGDTTVSYATITDHLVGITVRGGTLSVSHSSIHDNTLAGVSNVSDHPITAENNWWGSASGPNDPTTNPIGTGDAIEGVSPVMYTPWLTSDPTLPSVSSVLFLPGIEGSRLYEGTECGKTEEEKLWDPVDNSVFRAIGGAGDLKVRQLSLDAQGKSICSDIYTKEGDIIDTIHGSDFYAALVAELADLKTTGVIADWKPVAYDWRLSLPDLLSNGTLRNGKIYYGEATSTPYIEQTLRALVGSSKSGKVTIIAHSNGGLVAKALLEKLGAESSSLVDRLILVGSPQSGTPEGLGALLFGYDQTIPSGVFGVNVVNAAAARALAQNSPMAYHLMPSETYLESTASDPEHPVIHFSGKAYTKEENAYGPRIATSGALKEFLTAQEEGRKKPADSDVDSAEILNPLLIDYAMSEHTTIDSWSPPTGIEVDQIAGWGVDTLAGIDFYSSQFAGRRLYKPLLVEDGDGVVTTPSALLIATSSQVRRYWVDLAKYNKVNSLRLSHKDIFEAPPLEDLIASIIQSKTEYSSPYISSERPLSSSNKKFTYTLHSPLTLEVADANGHVTGIAPDGRVSEDIFESSYGSLGEVKYVTVPEGAYTLTMHGLASGTFTLDLDESTGSSVLSSTSIEDVPTTASTTVTLTVSGGPETASPLAIDEDGDGNTDITIPLSVGTDSVYEPRVSQVHSVAPSQSVSGGAISIPLLTPVLLDVATSTLSTTTVSVAFTLEKKAELKRPAVRLASSTPQSARVATHTPVYHNSQQSAFQKLGAAVYNGWYGFWNAVKKLF